MQLLVALILIGLADSQRPPHTAGGSGSDIISPGELDSFSQSELEMRSNGTIGPEMFEIESGKGERQRSLKFGLKEIVELDDSGDFIDTEGHSCKFDSRVLECKRSNEVTAGEMEALDEDGNVVAVPYSMKILECDLGACNSKDGVNASIAISTYIFKAKGYICQPNCTASDTLRSAVFNGTAKWSIFLEDWNFCDGSAGCDNKTAASMKIYFGLSGKRKGKVFRPKKRPHKQFDSSECEEERRRRPAPKDSQSKEDGRRPTLEDREEGRGENDGRRPSPDDGESERGGNGPAGQGDAEKGRPQQNGNGDDERQPDQPRKGPRKCNSARSTGFDGEPEDQDSFSFENDNGDTDSMTFRMFPMALLDEYTIATSETGFVGPDEEELADEVDGRRGQPKGRGVKYISISVPKFAQSLLYDPTGDMAANGGTEYGVSKGRLLAPSLLLLLASVLCNILSI